MERKIGNRDINFQKLEGMEESFPRGEKEEGAMESLGYKKKFVCIY